ncbi:VanZ family protein [Clostridium sp.]|uniref:VanZ family protein n=1 Tax=Clostridium sp. TaxID=1506 RepID=UPI002FCAC858
MINTLFIVGLIFYILFVLWNILFKYVSPLELFSTNRYFSRTLNLIPFNDILNGYYNKLDIFGNIILFIPLGIYINIIMKNNKALKNIYIIVVISLLLETIQYIFGIGASDITDIITNTIGDILGIFIYMILKNLFVKDFKVKSFITICSILIMLPVTLLLIAIIAHN